MPPTGSEGSRAALSKDQQAEARDINRSLLTLGKVVFELAKGNGHVPFRDSLLTRLLKVRDADSTLLALGVMLLAEARWHSCRVSGSQSADGSPG